MNDNTNNTAAYDAMMTDTARAARKALRDERSAAKWERASRRNVTVTDMMLRLLAEMDSSWAAQTNVLAAAVGQKTSVVSTLLNTMERWGLCSHLSHNPGTSRATRTWNVEFAGKRLI